VRTPPGSPRTVAGGARRPWWPFPLAVYSCGYSRLRSRGIEQGIHLRSDRERVLCLRCVHASPAAAFAQRMAIASGRPRVRMGEPQMACVLLSTTRGKRLSLHPGGLPAPRAHRCRGTSTRLAWPLGARPPGHARRRGPNAPSPLGSPSWAGMPPVGVGVARSIRSVISPWRRACSRVGWTHLSASIARALGRSMDRS
jgi:hypothetical protein